MERLKNMTEEEKILEAAKDARELLSFEARTAAQIIRETAESIRKDNRDTVMELHTKVDKLTVDVAKLQTIGEETMKQVTKQNGNVAEIKKQIKNYSLVEKIVLVGSGTVLITFLVWVINSIKK